MAQTIEDLRQAAQKVTDILAAGEKVPEVSTKVAYNSLRRTLNITTANEYMEKCLANYEANTEHLKAGKGLQEFDPPHQWQSVPAFLVGAGPSLEKNAKELRRVKGRFPILACDAALRPLIHRHGIHPDGIFIVDCKPCQADFWADVDIKDTILFAASCVDPSVITSWPGEIRFWNSTADKETEQIQLRVGQDFGSIPVGGNVMTAAFCFARMFLHANPIVFVGHDYAFPDPSRYYTFGAVHERSAWSKKLFSCYDVNGEQIVTDLSLYSYHLWTMDMVRRFQRMHKQMGLPPLQFINATEGGILGLHQTLKGKRQSKWIENRNLAGVVDDCLEFYDAIHAQLGETP